jgi:hypothetical protein
VKYFLVQGTVAAVLAAILLDGARQARAQSDPPAPTAKAAPVGFDQVRPVLRKRCLACHDQNRERGGLDLSSLDGIKSGSTSGPVVVSGNPDESQMYLLAAHLDNPKMPPNSSKIPQREIDLIRRWIEDGLLERGQETAKSPSGAPSAPERKNPAPSVASEKPKPVPSSSFGAAIEPLPRATAITALAVSPKEPVVALSGHKQIVLFRWTDGSPLGAIPFPEGDVFALRFSRAGDVLVAGGGVGGLSGKVVGFEAASGKRLFELGDERDAVLALDISPDKSLVALGGPGRSVKVFRISDGQLQATLRRHTDWILSLAFSPEGLLLASGDRFGGLQVWEAESGKEFFTLRGHVGAVGALAWMADSERLFSAGQDGSLRLWDMHQGTQIARWDGGVGGILCVECDAAGRVACGGRGKALSIWEKPEGAVQHMSMPDEIAKLGLSHDGSHVIAGDAAGNVAVFALANGELARKLPLPVGPAQPGKLKAVVATREPARPVRQSGPLWDDVAKAEDEARQAAEELAQVREARALADRAANSAEETSKQLRQSAAKLAAVVSSREAAARLTAQKASDLRAKAQAVQTTIETPATGSREFQARREEIEQQLVQKRSLLESTKSVAERIERAAAQSPRDTRLAAAAWLAAELRTRLAQDVEVTTAELRLVDESSDTAGN